MHRIDGPAALPGGHFSEGDPATGSPATVLTADWAEAVQEELCAVIAGAGLALAKANNAQLLAAIRRLAGAYVPVGTVMFGYFPVAPEGFLLGNGGLVSRPAYQALWSWVSSQGLVVAESEWAARRGMFSSGDGSSTFRLPDLRGEFPRFADFGRGVDDGRTLGSTQSDAIRNITGFIGNQPLGYGEIDPGGAFYKDGNAGTNNNGNEGARRIRFDASRVVPTAAENRPRNVSLAGVIRY